MRLMFVHLSDIHFEGASDPILQRIEMVKGAVQSAARDVDGRFLVVTGDVASSGRSEQYAIAIEFFDRLMDSLNSSGNGLVDCVYVPGNHDCDLQIDPEVRETLIDAIPEKIGTLIKGSRIINVCLTAQREFFGFLTRVSDGKFVVSPDDQILYRKVADVNGEKILFRCFNTAWMSRLKEDERRLYYPVEVIDEDGDRYDLVLSLLHHPYNWLHPDNARAFRKIVENTSDIVLTGHEHEFDYYVKATIGHENPAYVEGGVLQKKGDAKSSFNIVLIDTDRRKRRVVQYTWSGELYDCTKESDWQTFERSPSLKSRMFENNATFLSDFLSDPGAVYKHPRRGKLRLEDIFVYPNLRDLSVSNISEAVIEAEEVVNFVTNNKYVRILSPDRGGKTALAKSLYQDLAKQGFVPLYTDGASMHMQSDDAFQKLLRKAFKEQYSTEGYEQFRQLDAFQKVLIMDDFHRTKLNARGKQRLLGLAARHFGVLIVFEHDLRQFDDALASTERDCQAPVLRRCEIMKFGHALRHELISKWHCLGQETSGDEADIEHAIARTEDVVTEVIGRDLVPAHPFFIIVIVQAIEKERSFNLISGEFGQYYDVLITMALSQTASTITFDTKCYFLASLAYALFDEEKEWLTEEDVERISNAYQTDYINPFPLSKMMRELDECQILRNSEDRYSFRYRYLFHYFVAKYFAINCAETRTDERLSKHLHKMATSVYDEEYASITIFLLYLTKDSQLISLILETARSLLDEAGVCTFGDELAFLNNLSVKAIDVGVEVRQEQKARRTMLKVRDHVDRLIEAEEPLTTDDGDQHDDREGSSKREITEAFRMLQITGQILRSFPGSLKGDLKLKIAREGYSLGLRTLMSFIEGCQESFEETSAYLIDNTPADIRGKSNKEELFFYFVVVLVTGMIKVISDNLASEHLKAVYTSMSDEFRSTAVAIVNLAIKLGHFKTIPVEEIIRLHREVRSDTFTLSILKLLVGERLFLYKTPYKILQQLCSELGIRPILPQLMDNKMKMLNQ
jgi:predicted MPP superfamily phosphohydrolase